VLFGWIEVSEVVPILKGRDAALTRMPWIADHPHIAGRHYDADAHNTLYVAEDQSKWSSSLPGGGRFQLYDDALRLTDPSNGKSNKSLWSLPAWFSPGTRPPLSYHSDPARWTPNGDFVRLQSVAKGQEFVLDTTLYPDAKRWIKKLIERYGSG